MGSIFHCIQHVKMCKNTDFQVHGISSFQFVKGSLLEGWGKVPHSKNSFGEVFEWDLFLIAFSMSKCVRIPSCT